jgi:phosphate:Na+ symporter
VLVAAIDLHLFVLTLIGMIGICFYLNLDRSKRLRPIVSALLGLGLLFLGLEVMRGGAHALAELPLVVELFHAAAGSAIPSFIAGTVLAMLTQSSSTVSILTIAMSAAGLLGLEQAMVLVYGATFGSGIGTYMIAASTAGTPRQLAIYQTFLKTSGVAVLLPALIVEQVGHIPLLAAGVQAVTTVEGLRIGLVYLACQVVAVTVAGLIDRVAEPLLARLAPPSAAEDLSRPRYLYEQALAEPSTALTLVEREQARIFALLPLHLGIADALAGESAVPAPDAAGSSAAALLAAVDQFLADLADTGANRETLEQVADRRAGNTLLQELHAGMAEFALRLAGPVEMPALQALRANLGEGLGALLLTAEDGIRTGDADELALVAQMTDGRDSLVDTLRRRVMAAERSLSGADQELLYGLTSLFERIVWLLRRFTAAAADQAERRAAAEA